MASTWKQSITTSAGIALMNKAYGVSSIIPTKAVTITDDISGYSVTQLMALTSVNYNQSRVPIVVSSQANTTRIGIDIDNKDVNEQYDYYGIGVYFKQVNTGEEVLFSVIPLTGAATIIPNQSGVATSSISIDSYTSIVPGTKVDLSVSEAGSVTRSDVEQIVAANQSYSFPKKPAASGIDFYTLKSVGIYQIKDDKTVVNAPDGFSGNGYIIVIGDGTTANPITQDLFDTVTGNKYSNSYDSDGNKWTGWEEIASKSDVTDLNNGLSTKVTDNKDGTEQLNGVKVQPYNKLTDTVGIRNYIATNSWIALGRYGYYASDGSLKPGLSGSGDLYSDYISMSPQTMLFTWYSLPRVGSAAVHSYDATKTWIKSFQISNAVGSTKIDLPSNTEFIAINVPNPNTRGGQSTLTIGDVKTDWTPAPEDKADDSKVVHSIDMRKPASDVAGIEEVNAKQDKIGYTPADDSKVSTLQTQVDNSAVGTNLLTGTGNHTVTGSDAQGGLSNETTDDLLNLFKGLEGQTVTVSVDYEYSGFVAGSGTSRIGWEAQIIADSTTYFGAWHWPNNDSGSGRISNTFLVPKNITGINEGMGFIRFSGSGTGTLSHLKLEKGSVATDWCPNPEDKVNVADMRKPASDVAGIEEVNAKQDKLTITPADDSKVVHTTDAAKWQKSKITSDSGDVLKGLLLANNDDLNAYLTGLSTGITTFYVQSGVANNPSTQSARGLFHCTGDSVGVGYLIDNNGNQWSIFRPNRASIIYTQLETTGIESKVVHNTGNEEIAGQKTFDVAPIDKTTGNPYITKSDVTTAVSAATANMVARNPNTGVVSEPVDFTNAKANGHSIIPIETSTDKQTAQANSTTTPNVIYLY